MPISGLTLTLHDDDPPIAALQNHPDITLGTPHGRYLPVVLDTPDEPTTRDLHAWIESLPGIAYADVTYVAFEDQAEQPEPAHA